MKRARLAGALAAVGALVLASCGTQLAVADSRDQDTLRVTNYGDGDVLEVPVQLTDGRTVTCLVNDSGYGGGLSCNWQEARP